MPRRPDPLEAARRAVAATARSQTLLDAARAWWPGLLVLLAGGAAARFVTPLGPVVQSLSAFATLALAAVLVWRGVQRFHPMDARAARARLELRAGVAELAPLSALDDRPAAGQDAGLWQLHQARVIAGASALTRPALPHWRPLDAAGLVAAVALAGLAALDPRAALAGLRPDLSPLAGDGPMAVEVWADPPAVLEMPPIRLDPAVRDLRLPEGSTIRATLDGPRGAPVLRLPGSQIRMQRGSTGAWTGRGILSRSGRIALERLGTRAVWQVTAVPDAPPVITRIEQPVLDPRGRILLNFDASDDHAIKQAFLVARPLAPPDGLKGAAPLAWPLPLPPDTDGQGLQIAADVAAHPYAGLATELWVEVRDASGGVGRSQRFRLPLPEPGLGSDLARSIQEVRIAVLREMRGYRFVIPDRVILNEPDTGLPVTLVLDRPVEGAPPGVHRAIALLEGLAILPDLSAFDPVLFLGLRTARLRLEQASTIAEAHAVDGLLWSLVVRAQSAGRTPGQQAVDQARAALEQALQGGATDSEIEALMQDLRDAVAQRLGELSQEANGDGGPGGGAGANGSAGQQVSEEDIAGMLDQLEADGTGGARQEALNQLDALGQLLDSLGSGQGNGQGNGQGTGQAGGPGGPGGGPAPGDPLEALLREQEQLSDETTARNDGSGAPASDLAERQGELARRLGAASGSDGTGGSGSDERPRGPEAMAGDAARQLEAAAEALRRGDLDQAAALQDQATRSLREAARGREEQQQSGPGNRGDTDALGRPVRGGTDEGRTTRVPEEAERRRARDVRDELRRRQADPNRPQDERGYIDRLLEDGAQPRP